MQAPNPSPNPTTVPSPLIGVAELAEVSAAATLLDVRYRMGGPHGARAYAAGHLPGAAYVDLDTDLAGPPGEGGRGGRHPLPTAAAFETSMRAVGVRTGRPVVVYDDWAGRAAARAWWLLRHAGHDDVRVLDGGWAAWLEAGGDVETTATAERPGGGDLVVRFGAMPVVDADHVRDVDVLLDARAPERYRGEHEPVDPVAGHVPGALNVPTEDNLADDGRMLDPVALRQRYATVGAGVGAGRTVAAYCGSGVTACHDVLALAVVGVSAALYPGSWSDWVSDPDRPVER